jgi:hypothetical protein
MSLSISLSLSRDFFLGPSVSANHHEVRVGSDSEQLTD